MLRSESVPDQLAGVQRVVDVTFEEVPLPASSFTQRLLELELQHVTDEVSVDEDDKISEMRYILTIFPKQS